MSAELLRDLARAKATFQLRAVEAIIRTGAQGIEAQRAPTTQIGVVEDESPVPNGDAPNALHPNSHPGDTNAK